MYVYTYIHLHIQIANIHIYICPYIYIFIFMHVFHASDFRVEDSAPRGAPPRYTATLAAAPSQRRGGRPWAQRGVVLLTIPRYTKVQYSSVEYRVEYSRIHWLSSGWLSRL